MRRVPRQGGRGWSSSARVWALNAGLGAGAAVLAGTVVSSASGPFVDRFRVAPWLLAVMFCMAEVLVVHLVFRREAYTFSLSEVPAVLGLCFVGGPAFLAAQLIGVGVALVVHRRQAPIKLCFNLAHMAAETGVALWVFHALGPGSSPLTLRAVGVTVLAVQAGVLVGAGSIAAVIAMYEDRPSMGKLAAGVVANVAAALVNSFLALTVVALVWLNPGSGWLMSVPAGVLLFSYRSLLQSTRKQESLEFLYRASRILHRGATREGPMTELLELARDTFNAEMAELTLLPPDESGHGLRTTVWPGARTTRLEPVEVDLHLGPEERGLPTPAMVVHLEGEHRRLGTMVMAGRSAAIRTFARRDVQLFETLANHVAVALENGVLESSLAQVTALKEELRHQAFHDELTGLGNRALFVAELHDAAAALDEGEAVAVLFVDLDDFKTVNDSLGHAAGDELLRVTAKRLEACVRPADVAARLGGDEFAVLLAGPEVEVHAAAVADRVLAALRRPVAVAGDDVHLSASLGLAVAGPEAGAIDDLLRNADLAMYTAKVRGKSRWEQFEPAMQAAVDMRHTVKTQLRAAIDRGELAVRYQPIVDIDTGWVVGAEALVRWDHPVRGLLPPSEFVPVAEETGLIGRLGRYVLRTACEQARLWQDRIPGPTPFVVAVNVSAGEFGQPGFVDNVASVMRESALPPSALVLEITESAMVDGPSLASKLRELKELGVRVAVDDFGTGYSSLSYLDELSIDILKIAKPFVDGLAADRNRPALAKAIAHLGSTLQLEVVAEGVEEWEQLDALRQIGCRLAQGYVLSRPVTAAELSRLLARGPIPMDGSAAAPSGRRRAADVVRLRRRTFA